MTTELQGLSYGVFTYPISKVTSGKWSATFGDAVSVIYKRANFNANPVLNTLPGFEDYKYDDVEQIIIAYANLVIAGQIPKLEKNVTEANHKKIVQAVQKQSGRSEKLVRVVLYEAYWAAYGNKPQIPELLLTDPKKLMEEETSGLPDMLESIKLVAILGISAYALAQIVKLKQSFDENR